MLPIDYQGLNFSVVTDLADFFRSKLPETIKIRGLMDNIKISMAVPQDRLLLEVAEGERVYKITMLTSDVKRLPFGYFVYIPKLNRLDVYSMDNPMAPLVQWRMKKPIFKNYSMLLDRVGIDKMFDKIVNVL